jgi:ABC-type multidrug transport system ATPase subunit
VCGMAGAVSTVFGDNFQEGRGQRLAIARALVHEPRLTILDEATTGLNPASQSEVLRAVAELRGRPTVAVSHQTTIDHLAGVVLDLGSSAISE